MSQEWRERALAGSEDKGPLAHSRWLRPFIMAADRPLTGAGHNPGAGGHFGPARGELAGLERLQCCRAVERIPPAAIDITGQYELESACLTTVAISFACRVQRMGSRYGVRWLRHQEFGGRGCATMAHPVRAVWRLLTPHPLSRAGGARKRETDTRQSLRRGRRDYAPVARGMRRVESELHTTDADDFFQAILALQSVQDCRSFFGDILSRQEARRVIGRWKVARHLHAGRAYKQITRDTGASAATIARVNERLQHGARGLARAVRRPRSAGQSAFSSSTEVSVHPARG